MTAPKRTKEEQKQIALDNHIANEKIHSLVVKIISWKAGIRNGDQTKYMGKVTPEEWKEYKKHIIKISTSESPERVLDKLKKTEQSIQDNNGFMDRDA